jgi:hypothetical protein
VTLRPLPVIAAALAAMVVLDLVLGRPLPGFWSLFGLVSCVILIVASKAVGKRFILRDADYYFEPSAADADDPPEAARRPREDR